jgi:23S rRNA (cytosine1962-C5)-methyltransferase
MLGYRLLDCGNFKKYEQVGPFKMIRPSPQAVWRPLVPSTKWQADAEFTRASTGDGKWEFNHKNMPNSWNIEINGLNIVIRLTDFGHIGIFPEHHNWPHLSKEVSRLTSQGKEFKLLNLFAYTGLLSLGASKMGASVVHVDASKTSVAWARENAELSKLTDRPIRWIVDDVQKFVQREVKRGSKYQGIVLDPPSYGRGVNGEVWKIEEHLLPLFEDLCQLMDKDFAFLQLSAHSQGYTPIAMQNILSGSMSHLKGHCLSHEMVVVDEQNRPLPSGACAYWIHEDSRMESN